MRTIRNFVTGNGKAEPADEGRIRVALQCDEGKAVLAQVGITLCDDARGFFRCQDGGIVVAPDFRIGIDDRKRRDVALLPGPEPQALCLNLHGSSEAFAAAGRGGHILDRGQAFEHAAGRQDGDGFGAFAQLGAQDELAIVLG